MINNFRVISPLIWPWVRHSLEDCQTTIFTKRATLTCSKLINQTHQESMFLQQPSESDASHRFLISSIWSKIVRHNKNSIVFKFTFQSGDYILASFLLSNILGQFQFSMQGMSRQVISCSFSMMSL